MTTNQICPMCETGQLRPITFSDSFTYKNRSITVDGLQGMLCDNCGADPILTEQIFSNQEKIADAKRTALSMLTGDQIRQIRERLKLSQKDCSLLLGGGANAFSKYERGEVIQSDAMDALLYVVDKFPFTLDALRHRHNIPTATRPVNELWIKSETQISSKTSMSAIPLPKQMKNAKPDNANIWKFA